MVSPELIAILSVGVAIGALVLSGQRSLRQDMADLRQDMADLRQDMADLRKDVGQLRERMAHLEGLLEGLREAIGTRPAA